MKTTYFRAANGLSLLVAALCATHAFAQAPARPDKIMSIAELRTCLKLEQSNKKTAQEILQVQEAFNRDQAAVKAEQAEVNKANDEIRATATKLSADRDLLSGLVSSLSTQSAAAKTDEAKAAVDAERSMLVERNRVYEQNAERFNAVQQAQRDRVAALNERIGAINQRNQTVNDRVEPHQKQVAVWREQCSKRRFREEDEIVIKKEIAAGN